MTVQDPKTQLVSADRPRTHPSEDLLGYAPFAKMIAQSVLRGSPADGLVVGIYGEWGLGKTTLLNFIEHFTKADADDDAPIVVRFNPWWFSGRDDLLSRFFREFEAAVLKRRAHSKRLREALESLGDGVATLPHSWALAMGKTLTAAARLRQPADLVALKDAVVQALTAKALRVVVFVDDIDRLLPSEMVDIFRLVRSVGDFPNVHYVLAFERQVVVRVLNDQCHTDGERYLEKIVQAPFHLPRPSASALNALFTRRLGVLLDDTDKELFDDVRWGDIFVHGIMPFLATPRHVTRLINAVAVLYPALRNEVNPVDFVAIEAIRVFVPNVYDIIRSSPARFIGALVSVEHLRRENYEFHQKWLAGVEANQEAVRAIIVRLFPSVARILAKNMASPPDDPGTRRSRRICAEQVFDAYFTYGLGPGLSRSAFRAYLEQDGEELGSTLRRLSEARRDDGHLQLRSFLEMLSDELGTGRSVNAGALLSELCAVGDAVIAGTRRTFSFDVPDDLFLVFAVQNLLERVSRQKRASALALALKTAGPSTGAKIVTILGAQYGRHGGQSSLPDERTITSESELNDLEANIRKRIEDAAADGSLWRSPGLPRLLLDWRLLGGEHEMHAAVRSWTAGTTNFIALLSGLVGMSSTGRQTLDANVLSAVFSLDDTIKRAKLLLVGEGLTAEQRAILQLVADIPPPPTKTGDDTNKQSN
jgi:predicted KAP-like P-loop ATPase